MTAFALDPRLCADSVSIARLSLCEARLMNDRRYPWLVLVPQRPGLVEITDLPRAERMILMDEIAFATSALSRLAAAHKMNVAALGNHVRQLHIHIIARKTDDAVWPDPIWGKGAPEPYAPQDQASIRAALAAALTSSSP